MEYDDCVMRQMNNPYRIATIVPLKNRGRGETPTIRT